jgi:ATP-binding cassette, subfamily B, bacterial PglK
MLDKIQNILGKKKYTIYKLFVFLNVGNFFFELISLLSIPIFITSIVSSEKIFTKLLLIENKMNYEINFITNDNLLLVSSLLVLVSFYLKNFFLSFQIYQERKFYKNFNFELKSRLYNYFLLASYSELLKKNPAELVRSTINDVRHTALFLEHLSIIIRNIICLIVIVLISLFLSVVNTLTISSIFFLLGYLYYKYLRNKIKRMALENLKLDTSLIKLVNESYSTIKDIKILSKEHFFQTLFKNQVRIYEKNKFFFDLSNKFPKIIMEIIAITLITISSFTYYLIFNDLDTLFVILSINAVLVLRFIPAVNALSTSYTLMKTWVPSLLYLNDQINICKNTKPILKYDFNKDKSKNKNFLSIENISFRYGESKNTILSNINIKINKGEIIGITGETGSGKSTLMHLLLGLIYPEKGNIFFNGESIYKNIDLWRKKISFISQDIFLLDSTIRENITFNQETEPLKKDLLIKCIETAKLKQKIQSLPDGIETKVGVNGLQLSGGERQRIAIARACYKDADIVFMDEFTSALDNKTESQIFENLINAKKNKTLILITHKTSTLKYCNTVYDVQGGEIKKINETV